MKKIFILLLFIPFTSWASVSIPLDEIQEDHLIKGQEYDLFEDEKSTLSFEEVLAHPEWFSSQHEQTDKVSHTRSNYWVRFQLEGNASTEKKVLEVITPQTDSVSLFVPQKGGGYKASHAGSYLPISEREYAHKNFVFDFQGNTDFSKPFFIRVHSSNKVGLLFKLHSQSHFTGYSLKEYWLLGFYYGILGLLILYNLIVFFYLRKKVYLAYVCMVLFSMGLSLSDDGLGVAYVWSAHPEWSQALGLFVLPLGFLVAYTLYAVTFWSDRFSWLRKVALLSTGAFLLYFLALQFLPEKVYFSKVYALPFIVIYGANWYAYLVEKYRPSGFFVLGNTFALFGLIVEQLRLLDILEGNVFSVYAFEMGIVLEFISLSLSLAYRFNREGKLRLEMQGEQIDLLKENEAFQVERMNMIREKEALTQKVNQELEQKVEERTREIATMNSNLQKLVKDLEAMSLTLDKENWQLKRVIKEEKQAKLSGLTATMEEVKMLFPTRIKCLQFLEHLKWSEGFSCKKCGNEKYSVNEENRSRKCSKCGKIESVTAGSLYHAQKIPFHELFLLTHLAYRSDKHDVPKLAEDLNVSETSIYRFMKKVRTAIDERPEAEKWEDLVFVD